MPAEHCRHRLTARLSRRQSSTGRVSAHLVRTPSLAAIGPAARREARFLGYASGNFGKNILWSTADITLLFMLTDMIGLPAATAGAIFFIGLACDAVLDIVVGWSAERTRTRFGQFRPYILIGAPLCAAAFVLLYSLPFLDVRDAMTVAAAVTLFRALFAIADIPHNALITRMTRDSRARTRIAGYRMAFSSIASLLISLAAPLMMAGANRPGTLLILALVAAGGAVATLVIAAFSAGHLDRPAAPVPMALREQIAAILASPDARILLGVTVLTGLFPPLFAKTFLYFGQYVLDEPHSVSACLSAMVLGQLVGIPFWSWLGAATEKAYALAASHLIAASGFFAVAVFQPGGWVIAALGLWCGLGLGGLYMLIWAMAPDVVEQIEAAGRGRPDAMLFALLIFAMKLAISFGAMALGLVLDVAGYRAGGAQPEDVRTAIIWMTGTVPATGGLLCAFVALGYRLGHREHARLRRQIAAGNQIEV